MQSRSRWSCAGVCGATWHYDTEYVLRGETRPGQARVQLFQADGTTAIADSSWIDVGDQHAAREGCLGFHVWSGRAEFRGFSETTRTDPTVKPPAAKDLVDLGNGWQALDGQWRWADADGTTVLVASPDIYVSEANNARPGHLGLTTRGTPAEFQGWELRK